MTSRTRGRGRASLAAALAVVAGLSTTALTAEAQAAEGLGYDPVADKGSLWHIAETIGAHRAHRAGWTGKGVGVALIDTGVAEVPGLDTGNVRHGPDLSFDSQDPELLHKDAYGHGTHLASIIAGRDAVGAPASYADPSRFAGIAPDANLISLKVGARDGAVDVSQVIAAVDWVVEHRRALGIRVLNLSYGTDSLQDPDIDPLMYAVEQAWKAGIVVVVAGGNDGSSRRVLANPARSPHVLAVGAVDTQGTVPVVDDTVPAWATRGNLLRHVDVVAPGVSVLGARVPNGYADERNPQARVADRFAKASGTSQAAAVVSGAAALLLQAHPDLSPDEVKRRLRLTAQRFPSADLIHRGRGVVDVADALSTEAPDIGSWGGWSNGRGSLEAARGSSHVHDGTSELRGERDIFGRAWDGASWARLSASQDAWVGGAWRGHVWAGDGWDGATWGDVTWSDGTWSASTWRRSDWGASTWRNGEWTASTWREGDWGASTWRSGTWSASTWRTADLASAGWLARTWG